MSWSSFPLLLFYYLFCACVYVISGFPRWHCGKEPACQCRIMNETRVQSLGQEDPLEEGMATHSSILAWRIPGIGSQRVRHDWRDRAHIRVCVTFIFWNRKKPNLLEVLIWLTHDVYMDNRYILSQDDSLLFPHMLSIMVLYPVKYSFKDFHIIRNFLLAISTEWCVVSMILSLCLMLNIPNF